MGLMDILTGMQNGPTGAPQSAAPGRGGVPSWMWAALGLLAYKALKGGAVGNVMGGNSNGGPATAGRAGGGLGDIVGQLLGRSSPGSTTAAGGAGLGGLLGGLLAGGAAGNLLSGGLRNLVEDMQQNGHAAAAQSWIGAGPNQALSPNDLASALGADDIDAVSSQLGMPREQVLSDLSHHLPDLVDRLTPNGRMPSDSEASQWV